MSRTHILLDLDGTISDSSSGIGRSLSHAFTACGYPPPTSEQVRSMIGPPFELTFPKMGIHAHDVERVILAYRDRYESIGLFENEVYRGIAEVLRHLDEAGFVLSLATAKPEPTAVRIIEHFGFTHHFDAQVGATVDVGSARRTKAEVITHALGVLDTHPGDHVVMVGDRDHDVEGALANGIECIGVSWGFGSHAELTAAGAIEVIDEPLHLLDAIAS